MNYSDFLNHTTKKFNDEHIEAIKKIVEFINKPLKKDLSINDYVFCLFGVAGSGKTTLIMEIVDYLQNQIKFSIFCCAPTHQAVNILKSKSNNLNITFKTIHSFLNISNDISLNDGDIIFEIPKELKKIFSINGNYFIIIDECSMIKKDLVEYLFKSIKKEMLDSYIEDKNILKKKIKILFLGDLAQLPPVNEQVNKLLEEKTNSHYLTKIVRTSNINIHKLSNFIRQWINTDSNKLSVKEIYQFKGNGVCFYNNDNNTVLTKWFKKLSRIISEKKNTFILLGWTNKICEYYNSIIRNYIFKDMTLKKIMKNEYIIFKDNYVCVIDEPTIFNTSEQVIVLDIEESKFNNKDIYLKYSLLFSNNIILKKFLSEIESCEFDVLQLKVEKIFQNDEMNNTGIILIIHDNSKKKIEIYKDKIKKKIQNLISKHYYNVYDEDNIKIIKSLWSLMYELSILPFANITYGYCMTVHKSQASTFGYVFVDLTNIFLNLNNNEAKRCLYTAITRTSDEINIII